MDARSTSAARLRTKSGPTVGPVAPTVVPTGPSTASSIGPTPAQAPLAERGQVMIEAEVVDALVSAMEYGVETKMTKVKEEENTARKEVKRLKAEKEREGEKELTKKKRHLTKCIKNNIKTCTITSRASTAPSIYSSINLFNYLAKRKDVCDERDALLDPKRQQDSQDSDEENSDSRGS